MFGFDFFFPPCWLEVVYFLHEILEEPFHSWRQVFVVEALTSEWMISPDLSAEDSSIIVPKTREPVLVATAEELIPKGLKPAPKDGKN